MTGNYDHHAHEYVEDCHEVVADLRQRCPVSHSDAHGGFYVVANYRDVADAFRDDVTFSSWHKADGFYQGILQPPLPRGFGFIDMDPPESSAYRKAFMPLFSPQAVKGRESRTRVIVRESLDDHIESGHMDLVRDFCSRVPVLVIMDILGLPIERWPEVLRNLERVSADPAGESGNDAIVWVNSFLMNEIQLRRTEPKDDGLTWLLSREIDGETMSDEMALEQVGLVVLAGVETTASLLAHTYLYLSEHPAERQRLIDDPSLIKSACEEFLRYFTPGTHFARTVTSDCELSGVELRPGDRVLLSVLSANRDEKEFAAADQVDIERMPNRHLAFGVGAHKCLGAHIARSIFALAVEEVVNRIPDYTVRREDSIRFHSIAAVNGWHSMPTDFTPTAPSVAGA